jgi:cation diffusion facilitator family transporter
MEMSEEKGSTGTALTAAEKTREVHRITLIGLVINLFLTVCKVLAGVLGGSQAVIADGVHSLSDSATDIVVLVGARFWGLPPDEDHPYGHRKVESIATIIIGLALGTVGVGLAYSSIMTMKVRHDIAPSGMALVAALLSIVIKEWLYRWTIRVGKRVKSSAVIANAWHHRSDAFSSIPVAIAVAASYVMPTWSFLDHVATVAVSLFILQATWMIISAPFRDLIETGADQAIVRQIHELASQVSGVKDVHKIRSRTVSGAYFIDLHVQVPPELNIDEAHQISGKVKKELISADLEIVDVLVHIEPFHPENENKQPN